MYRDLQDRSPNRDDEDEVIRRVVAHLRAPLSIDAQFDARVMTAVRAEPRVAQTRGSRGRRVVQEWWMSVAFMAVAALILLIVRSQIGASHTGATNHPTRPLPTTVANPRTIAATHTHPVLQSVRFEFVTPEIQGVHRVTVVGSFNGWNTAVSPLRAIGGGRWVTEIPLSPGRYTYQFVINGRRWVPDPGALRDPGSEFGASNSVVTVPEGGVT